MEIKQLLIPASNTKTRPGIKMTPKYITVHETDNTAAGANAAAHAKLQFNGNSRTASWHFTVDDHEIWQSIPEDEIAWHAGDGHGTGNMESLAIEICVNSNGDFEKAKANAIWLIHYLMDKHGIPIDRVVPHQHWSGKNCPRHILTYWNTFINQIKSGGGENMPKITYHNDNELPLSLGSKGELVKKVQQRLGITADGYYGPNTKASVEAYQKQYGLKVDGIVGQETWHSLFRPTYRVEVEGKVVLDTVYSDKIAEAVKKAIDSGVKEIKIYPRS
ncbi:N-acetylmuramoyl-L-alanine amidase [Thermoactinomyces sp. CICC 10521]|uniref:peptidoglycan recognition protein family protein n=1 Tax=Thermoactinomyces sp. CICC 10521 TaxID=2767426 RepID=UPI0018DB5C92|nr:N-acetylmuramoyl-L-alanine amidase [Thermoactinomyces sp. CICC 10521]